MNAVGELSQMYPNAGPSTLLHRFFKLMAGWNWPNAIQLVQPYDADLGLEVGGEGGGGYGRSWCEFTSARMCSGATVLLYLVSRT